MRRGGTLIVAVVALGLLLSGPARAANPIQDENALQGSAGWDVPSPTPGTLEGYANRISAVPGDAIDLKVSSTESASYRVEVYRLGWYGGLGGRLMTCLPGCGGSTVAAPQPYPTPDPVTGMVRAQWATTDSFTVGPDWVSGYYIALLKKLDGGDPGSGSVVPFIVRAPAARPKSILVQASVNTWQAYNKWGGKSLYNSNSTGGVHADKVSFDRPFHRDTQGVYAYDLQLVRFLEREGHDAAYQTDVDTHQDPLGLRAYRLVASAGHDEYWSKEMRDGFEGARDVGVNLAFFGANTAYWQQRYEDGGRTIVGYKDRAADPEPDQELKTIQFRVLIPARPECELLGVQYQGGSLPDGAAYLPYTTEDTNLGDPWFGATGFAPGATVPDIVGYEWDSIVPGCAVPGTPKVLLKLEGATAADTAHTTRYTAPSGAKVFATGTLNWSWKLDSFVAQDDSAAGHGEDARIQQLTRNVLDDLTAPVSGNAPPTASFTRDVASPSAGQTVTFTDTSTDSDGTIAARAWDLDDDGQYDDGAGASATRSSASTGATTVRLRVTDNRSASTTTAMTFVVGSGYVAPIRPMVAPAPGKWRNVQHQSSFSPAPASSLTVTPSAPLLAGNMMIVSVAWGDQTSTPTITDGLGNVYRAIGRPARYAGRRSVQLFYAKRVNGGSSSITATFSAAVENRYVGISEYSGLDTAAPLVASATGRGGNASASRVPVAATAPGQLLFAINQNGAAGISRVAGNTPTLLDTGSAGNVGQAHGRSAVAGAAAITFRFNARGAWATAAAVFRARSRRAPARCRAQNGRTRARTHRPARTTTSPRAPGTSTTRPARPQRKHPRLRVPPSGCVRRTTITPPRPSR